MKLKELERRWSKFLMWLLLFWLVGSLLLDQFTYSHSETSVKIEIAECMEEGREVYMKQKPDTLNYDRLLTTEQGTMRTLITIINECLNKEIPYYKGHQTYREFDLQTQQMIDETINSSRQNYEHMLSENQKVEPIIDVLNNISLTLVGMFYMFKFYRLIVVSIREFKKGLRGEANDAKLS